MTARPTPHGKLVPVQEGSELQLQRTFALPAETVWAAVTESDRLEQWIGRWEGDTSTGQVSFFMTAESPDAEASPVTIHECARPHRLSIDTGAGEMLWHLRLEIADVEGGTVLTFVHLLGANDQVENVGPGWEYYLDRLVAVLTGGDVATISWDNYYPAMSAYYDSLA
ncbi:SRPBCC family protein [Gulosibacter molinativorax]|uniref:Activator of Hsp90 ATPase homologue 1/2-like C-terminal domain-containing protein n=1 Tax=Gulosibacter molinativorax TaxID=256821 RepID=A0ABT7C5N7_9MICO|nr:SRPBCC family protein [Gulosibacter molinativorax]MDJ1370505.1 hypothetical protein [Gulosibacter molinativorax]QUY62084.1 Polyketide cyclase [Gulosibacter molinativorax]